MKCYLQLLYSTQIPYCYSMVSYLIMLLLGTRMRPNSVFLLVIVGLLLHSLTWFPFCRQNVLETVWEKKLSKNALGLICRDVCEWNIACVLVVFCFDLNCELFFKCEVISRSVNEAWVFVSLCGLFNVIRYFVNDLTWQNTLPQSLKCTTASLFQKVVLLSKMLLQL